MNTLLDLWLDLWTRINELFAPIADGVLTIKNAPVFVVGGLVVGGVAWFWSRLNASAVIKRQDERLARVIRAAMEKSENELAERNPSNAPTVAPGAPGGPREELRNALEKLLTSDDPRGAEVAHLVTEGKTERAATVSRAIAEDSEAVLAQLEASANDARKAAAQKWRYAGAVAFLSATKDAVEAYEKAHALDPDHIATLFNLAQLYMRMGKFDEAAAYFTKLSQDGHNSFEDRYFQASALSGLGVISQTRGNFTEADAFYRRAIAIFVEIGAGDGQANQLLNLSSLHYLLGDLDGAEQMANQAFAYYEAAQLDGGMVHALNARGVAAIGRDNIPLAEAMFERALGKCEKLGWRESQANMLLNLAFVARLNNKFDLAVSRCRESIDISTALKSPESVAAAQVNMGAALIDQGEFVAATHTLTEALTTLTKLDSREFQYYANAQLARIRWKLGEKAEAKADWTRLLAQAAEAKVDVITKELRRILANEGLNSGDT